MSAVLVVGHAATRTGAPRVLLSTIRWLQENTPHTVSVVLLDGGELVEEFRSLDPRTRVLDYSAAQARWTWVERALGAVHLDRLRLKMRSRRLRSCEVHAEGADIIYVNSAASLAAVPATPGVPVVVHLHEMEHALRVILPGPLLGRLHSVADHLVAPTPLVLDAVAHLTGRRHPRATIVPEPLERTPRPAGVEPRKVDEGPLKRVVLGCGTAEWRKGTDLFLLVAQAHDRLHPGSNIEWRWVGADESQPYTAQLLEERRRAGTARLVTLMSRTSDLGPHFADADVFVLTSREDPYPLVALAAAEARTPVVCFEGAGGIAELAGRGAGVAVPHVDVVAMADAVEHFLADPQQARAAGEAGRRLVEAEHRVDQVVPLVAAVLDAELARRTR